LIAQAVKFAKKIGKAIGLGRIRIRVRKTRIVRMASLKMVK
jgi:hypothetical protein